MAAAKRSSNNTYTKVKRTIYQSKKRELKGCVCVCVERKRERERGGEGIRELMKMNFKAQISFFRYEPQLWHEENVYQLIERERERERERNYLKKLQIVLKNNITAR